MATAGFAHYDVDEHGCWIWRGQKARGYGLYQRSGNPQRRVHAHRAFYEHYVGSIPEDLQIDHLCRVRACVNPDHLEPVTSTENVRRSNATKLTADDVRAIRGSSASYAELAEAYGVAKSTISRTRHRVTWRDLA